MVTVFSQYFPFWKTAIKFNTRKKKKPNEQIHKHSQDTVEMSQVKTYWKLPRKQPKRIEMDFIMELNGFGF